MHVASGSLHDIENEQPDQCTRTGGTDAICMIFENTNEVASNGTLDRAHPESARLLPVVSFWRSSLATTWPCRRPWMYLQAIDCVHRESA